MDFKISLKALSKRLLLITLISFALFSDSKALNPLTLSRHGLSVRHTDEDPFTQYLNSVPKVLQTLSTVNTGSGNEAITTKEIIYSSKMM